MERSTERVNIVSCSSSKVAGRHIELCKIDKLFFGEPFKQFAIRFPMVFHPMCGTLSSCFCGTKRFIHIKDIQTIDSFFGMPGTSTACRDKFQIQADGDSNQFVKPIAFKWFMVVSASPTPGKITLSADWSSSLSAVITASTPPTAFF